MVCLNENISFRKIKLRDNLIKKVTEKVNNNFYLNELNKLKVDSKIKSELAFSIINNVNKIIKDEIKNLFSSDNFIYVNMDDNICGHKFNKGKREGYYCCKKITRNGDKEKYVCTQHNKNHIPKKKKIKYLNQKIKTGYDSVIFKNKKIIKRKIKLKKKKIIVKGIIDFKDIINKLLF